MFILFTRECIMLCVFFIYFMISEEKRLTYHLGADGAIVAEEFHGSMPELVVSGHLYVGNDGPARRVKEEVLAGGRRDDVRHGRWYRWNSQVDEVLSGNRDDSFGKALLYYRQMIGGCAAYLGWYWTTRSLMLGRAFIRP